MSKNNKNSESVSKIFSKVSDFGKKAADGVHKSAKAISEKAKSDSLERKMKKYNPLFKEEFESNSFNIPNMIKIVDDAERRNIEICEGAIGWREKVGAIEVLFLYDEAVNQSGLKFYPMPSCNTFYCVDNFDRKCFISVDKIFSKSHNERLAELEHIAYCLGATYYSIEIIENSSEKNSAARENNGGAEGHSETRNEKKKSNFGEGASTSYKISNDKLIENGNKMSGLVEARFEANNELKRPKLKWFAFDNHIKGLIEMRLSSNNTIKNRTLVLEGSSSATMSQNFAISVDMVLDKKGNKSKFTTKSGVKADASMSMEKQANKENYSKLLFKLEF